MTRARALSAALVLALAFGSGCSFVRDFDDFSIGDAGAAGGGAGGGDGGGVGGGSGDGGMMCSAGLAECLEEVRGCDTDTTRSRSACGGCGLACTSPEETCSESACAVPRIGWSAWLRDGLSPPTGPRLARELAHDSMGRTYVLLREAGPISIEASGDGTGEVSPVVVPAPDADYGQVLVAIDPDGTVAYVVRLSPSATGSYVAISAVVVDDAGGIYLAGRTSSTNLTLYQATGATTPISFTEIDGKTNGFVIALTRAGIFRKTLRIIGDGAQGVEAIVTRDSKVYITGTWDTDLLIGSQSAKPAADSSGTYFAVLDAATFAVEAATSFSGSGVLVDALGVDEAGNVFAGGDLSEGSVTVGADVLPPPPHDPADGVFWPYALSLDPELAPRWVQTWDAGNTEDYGTTHAAIAPNGVVYLALGTTNAIDLGAAGSVAAEEVFMMSLDPATGEPRRILPLPAGVPEAMDLPGDGRLLLGFWGAGPMDFGGGELTSAGGGDVFVFELEAETFAYRWGRALGGIQQDTLEGGVIGLPDGSLVVAGKFQGTISFPDEFMGDATIASGDGLVMRLAVPPAP